MSEKTELGIVGGQQRSGPQMRPRFRVVKVPKESVAGDSYAILGPGTIPSGLHLSEHASGTVHLRATTRNGVITLDLAEVARRFKEVGPGPVLRLTCRPPTAGHKARGLIVPGEAATPVTSPGHIDIDTTKVSDSLVGFEIEDSKETVETLRELKTSGILHDEDFVQILILEIDECCFYKPLVGPFPEIPEETPFAKDLRRVQAQVEADGGLFMTMGGPPEILQAMRQIAGCDLILDFVEKIATDLDDPSQVPKLTAAIMQFVDGLQPSAEAAVRRGALPPP
jgi:hypothetical protein